MFNYLFPIFCFGLVMTGIVFLGILEAAKQVKADSLKEREPEILDRKPNTLSPCSGQSPRFAARSINE
jgi:hypothetical protein